MILKGNDLIIKVGGVALAASKSCKISIKAKTSETSSPSDGDWEHSRLDRKSWNISTNHLVQSLTRSAQMVGTTVTIEVGLRYNVGTQFHGFVNNVSLESGTYSGTGGTVMWDKTRKIFVKYYAPAAGVYYYYSRWNGDEKFKNLSAYDMFYYNNVNYTWLANDLTAEKLTGQAHITGWDCSGARGNLIVGGFDFKGTGPLTPATLP